MPNIDEEPKEGSKMNQQEINDAAERVRRVKNGEQAVAVYRDVLKAKGYSIHAAGAAWNEHGHDRNTLVNFALSQLAERDETPIDEAWLRSIGFTTSDHGTYVSFDSPKVQKPSRQAGIYVAYVPSCGVSTWHVCYSAGDGINIPDITTRGQLLRLLDSLGINITTDAGAK